MPPPKVNGAATHESQQPAARPEETAGDVLRDALECGVRTAYTVIDEYLRRGNEAARNNRDHLSGRGPMRDERSNFSGWNSPWGQMGAPMQQWICALQAWTNAWSAFMPGGWTQPMGAGCTAAAPPVSVRVSSHSPAEVTTVVDLIPGAECIPLTVDTLTGEGNTPPHLKDVSITSEQGCVRIHVPIPEYYVKGKYIGEIKSGGRTAGHLTVVIADPPRESK
jgi:hypothetical protein